MATQTIALNPGSVTRGRILFRDGENLTLTVARNGVAGDLAIAIGPTRAGKPYEPQATVEAAFTGDSLTLTALQLEPVAEGALFFYSLWNTTDNSVRAEGQLRKSFAIRTAPTPAPVSPGFFATLDGQTLTAGNGTLTLSGATLETT